MTIFRAMPGWPTPRDTSSVRATSPDRQRTILATLSGLPLNKPIVGMTPTSDGNGYWLVASDGGIFTYGDANFYGSAGSIQLTSRSSECRLAQTARGYTLVATDGGVFNYGDSQFYGSLGSIRLNSPIEGIVEHTRRRRLLDGRC